MCVCKKCGRIKCQEWICVRETKTGWALMLSVMRRKSQQRLVRAVMVYPPSSSTTSSPFYILFLVFAAQLRPPPPLPFVLLLLGVGREKKNQVTDRLTPASLHNVTNSSPFPLKMSFHHYGKTHTHTQCSFGSSSSSPPLPPFLCPHPSANW